MRRANSSIAVFLVVCIDRGKVLPAQVQVEDHARDKNRTPKGAIMLAIEAREITRSLPLGSERIDILRGISFEVEKGEWVALTGPSGSGKSTLLGIVSGLDS